MRHIDLRSDTVTMPTDEMRQAMRDAEVGDDVYGDDPTVNKLEALAAETLGKQAAMFVPTGTMGNQIAVMVHTRPGDEIITSRSSHVYVNEAGGYARLAGASCALADNAPLAADDINRLVRSNDIHYPRTTLVAIENALGNGDVMTLDQMDAVRAAAKKHNLAIHLDGARIFNAAVSLGVKARDIAARADTVMFCVSKGLCSPVGSLLCGDAKFIAEARRCRKLLGGGMRQAGVLAACGILSLTKMVDRLAEDHDNARLLGQRLAGIPGLEVDSGIIKINMTFWRPKIERFDNTKFVAFMLAKGIKVNGASRGSYRMVTHHGVTRENIERAAQCVKEYVASL